MSRIMLGLVLLVICSCKTPMATVQKQAVSGSIYADRFGNIYELTSDNLIKKYSPKGKFLYEYANTQRGNITHIDPTDPQRIIAFVQDYNSIILLDNTLSEINNVRIDNTLYPDVEMVASSNDGNIWLFDNLQTRLVKIDETGQRILESNRLTDFSLSDIRPTFLIERENQVFMSDRSGNVHVFDNFGQYIKAIPLEGVGKFQVLNNEIYYLHDGIQKFDLQNLELSNFVTIMSESPIKDILIIKNGVLTLTEKGINWDGTQ